MMIFTRTFNPTWRRYGKKRLIYAVLKLRQKREPPKIRKVSNIKNCDWEKFREEMQMVPWSVCSIFEDLDDCSWAGEKLFLDVRKKFISERQAKIRGKKLPWINTSLRKEMNKNYKLLIKAKRSKDHADWALYRTSRNRVTALL